jgi:peptidoglycan/LPS O-acetylase OafA/YrhL
MAQEIRTLTGLRGVAALGVVNHHVNIFVVGGTVWLRGQTFVDLFFVLSGFVMSLAYLGRDAPQLDWSGFLRARFARIYPLHFLTALLMALCLAQLAMHNGKPLDGRFTLLSGVRELLLLGAMPLVAARELWNYPSWSISVEWWTYFSVFPVIVMLRKRGATGLLGCGFLLLACAVAASLYCYDEHQIFRGGLAFQRAAVGFGTGWFIWELSRRREQKVSPALTKALLLSIVVAIYAAPAIGGSDAWFLLPVYPLLIYALAANDEAIAWLNHRIAVWLGDISYSLYLIHPLVLLGLKQVFDAAPEIPQAQALLIYGAAATAISISLSAASYRWLEKPARALLSAHKQPATQRLAPRQNARLPVSVSHHMRQSPAKE